MKRLINLMLLTMLTVTATAFSADNFVDKVYKQVQNSEGVTIVNVTPAMLDMFKNKGEEGDEKDALAEIIAEIKSIKILTIDLKESGLPNAKVEKIKSDITDNYKDYTALMEVNQKGKAVKILSNKAKKDFVLYVLDDTELVIININGSVDFNKLMKLGGLMGGQVPELMQQMQNGKAEAGENK